MKWKLNLPVYYFCFAIVFQVIYSSYISELDSQTLISNTYLFVRTFYQVVPLILVIVIIVVELIKKKRNFAKLINIVFYNLVALYTVSAFWGLFVAMK
ncbi:hypothetical protein CI105_04675 [Candidatus Izimaplasma bacterium ZiA1]|uniref:hypothetical protein n=1 Tax=Candidatus Izimoplasma sp. ZiA1 TaxID=2024899 RepID=UPI000BAA91A2|nr:hypothetical protein CI105_04675 [Candidatus Izimaplasma bacterium ZiA1]